MNRFPRPAEKRPRADSGLRHVLIIVGIGVTLALGALGAEGYMIAKHSKAAAAAAKPNDDEIYTGSILYMPDTSNVCHQWLFDNHNGQFRDIGYVDCERAFYQGGPDSPKQWSAARVRVISTGFRGE
jgi:hypothetical protein